MEYRNHRIPRTILSLPNSGRTSVWTGRTTSGQTIHSVVALPNRTVQLHFHCDETIPPYTKAFENTHFERLATFLYEYPMRHFGHQVDDPDNSEVPSVPVNPGRIPDIEPLPNMRPGIQNGGPLPRILPQRLFHNQRPGQSISHFRMTHAPTIGREIVYGCPKIGHDLAMASLQTKSVLYTHHLSGTVNVLIIKLFIAPADEEFDSDHTEHYLRHRTFPNFNFHQPVLSREHFRMGDITHISRNGIKNIYDMFHHILTFNVSDRRMPKVEQISLHIQLNEVLENELDTKPKPFFTHDSTSQTLDTIVKELGRKNLLNIEGARISNLVCKEIFEKIRYDSCFKTLAEHLSLDQFYALTLLLRTSFDEPRLNIFLSLHA